LKNRALGALQGEGTKKLASSLSAIALGLAIGFAVLLASDASHAVSGFGALLFGAFSRGAKSFGQVLYQSTPIIMTGLAFAFAAKAGLFNIGMPGQFVLGAFCAIYASVNLAGVVPKPALWAVSVAAAMAAGALWASAAGLLKAFFNVNEVISCIMLNYIGMYLVNMAIVRSNIYNSSQNLTVAPRSFIPAAGFDKVFPDSGANIGTIVALFASVACYVLLNFTVFGYELRMCGLNRSAARYAGVREKRAIIAAMAIAGSLAGIGGGLFYLSNTGKYMQVADVLAAEGFNGIPVALIALNNPVAIFFTGVFIAYLNVGSLYMQRYGYVPELVNIVISVIIYCSALSAVFRNLLFGRFRKARPSPQPEKRGEGNP
jgi:simple sugar transport system permease protein